MGHGTREVWVCDVCGWAWIPDKTDKLPAQCPNRKCRSRRWNSGAKAEHRAVDAGVPKDAKRGKQISAEEFMKLSRSEQLRARREGKF